MSSTFVRSLGACPGHYVVENATTSTNMTSSTSLGSLAHLATLIQSWDSGDTTMINTTTTTMSPPTVSPPQWVSRLHTWFDYPSTTILFALLALECLAIAIIILWRFNGITSATQLRQTCWSSATSVFRGSSSTRRTSGLHSPDAGSSFDDAVMAHHERPLVDATSALATTNNAHWAFFFLSNFVLFTLAAIALDNDRLPKGAAANDSEVGRILIFVSRLVRGATSLLLTTALNYQRLHRHKDDGVVGVLNGGLGGAISSSRRSMEKQVRVMNIASVAIYVLYAASDFVAAHFVSLTADANVIYLAAASVADLLLNAPNLFAVLWIVVHRGDSDPSLRARVVVGIAVVLRFICILPQPLWDDYIFDQTYRTHPCPLTVFSLYDLVLVALIAVNVLFSLFVSWEHIRMEILERQSLDKFYGREFDEPSEDSYSTFRD